MRAQFLSRAVGRRPVVRFLSRAVGRRPVVRFLSRAVGRRPAVGLRRSGCLLAVAAVVVTAGCSGSDGSDSAGSGADGGTLRVLIPDGNLRELGESCNGAGAFRSVHAEAGYVIEDGDGVEVARGELPNGTAEKLMDVEFREGMRQPTMCVMEFAVEGLSTAEGHEFVVGDGFTLPIEPSEDAGIIGEVLVS